MPLPLLVGTLVGILSTTADSFIFATSKWETEVIQGSWLVNSPVLITYHMVTFCSLAALLPRLWRKIACTTPHEKCQVPAVQNSVTCRMLGYRCTDLWYSLLWCLAMHFPVSLSCHCVAMCIAVLTWNDSEEFSHEEFWGNMSEAEQERDRETIPLSNIPPPDAEWSRYLRYRPGRIFWVFLYTSP